MTALLFFTFAYEKVTEGYRYEFWECKILSTTHSTIDFNYNFYIIIQNNDQHIYLGVDDFCIILWTLKFYEQKYKKKLWNRHKVLFFLLTWYTNLKHIHTRQSELLLGECLSPKDWSDWPEWLLHTALRCGLEEVPQA